jgi:HAD superfamily hydrolase (TIGR01548 family)
MVKDLIVFDMDGVLVEVTESYRATIQAVVKHFTGYEPTRPEIQDWKNRGGWNDDWLLSHAMVKEQGGTSTYDQVVDYFQKLFLGENNDGQSEEAMITREEWIAKDGLFDRLAATHTLAVFTGRLNSEAHITLNRFLPNVFAPVVGSDNVATPKPSPEGLIKIRNTTEHGKCWYIGDTVDDARASKAAGVPFIGIAARANPRYDELVRLLKAEDAVAILDDINGLEAVLAQNL